MATVYAIARGEYSDYRIVAIYSTRELAQKVVDEINSAETYSYNEASIEEYELDTAYREIELGYHYYFVRLSEGGDVQETRRDAPSGYNDLSTGRDIRKGYFFHCWAEDDIHAIKIAKDRRAQLVAMSPS